MISVTEKAVTKVTNIMKEQEVSDKTKIRVGVKGGGCSGFTYTVDFETRKGKFDLEDFTKQLKQMGKMGGVSGILSMLPGVSKAQKQMAENNISVDFVNSQIAIINSMTKKERVDPNIIKASRKIRISKGSGTRVQDVNKLLKQFLQSQKMMKKMKSMGKGGLPNDFMQKFQGKLPTNFN